MDFECDMKTSPKKNRLGVNLKNPVECIQDKTEVNGIECGQAKLPELIVDECGKMQEDGCGPAEQPEMTVDLGPVKLSRREEMRKPDVVHIIENIRVWH